MTSQNGPQYFSHLSNTVINNPIITHVSGNVYNGSSTERYGLKLLLRNISEGAFHDSAERGDPPRCHLHTRTAIRAEIMEWIQAPDATRKLILWMHGPAGAGKTAIAQSIAEECQRQGLLAASFFFGRTAAGRKDASRFVATIAYQLSLSIPEISDQILSAIEKDQTIFSCALVTQMRVLVIEPLKSLSPSSRPIFMITDGVDECGPDRKAQTTFLNAIGIAIPELRHIPLILLIASHPEYEIREAFNGHCLSPLVKSLVLDDTYKPDDDIRLYLNSVFQEIHNKHDCLIGSCLPSPWPAEAAINQLVLKSSGQFIFVSMAMKFIDSSQNHPQDRLDVILGLSVPGNETPFALLDALYHSIISSIVDIPKVLEVFKILMFGGNMTDQNSHWTLNIAFVEWLLGSTISAVLVDMQSLVHVPQAGNREVPNQLQFHHALLYDFLTDQSRSHEYYINPIQARITLSRCWLNLIANYSHTSKKSFHNIVDGFLAQCKKLPTRDSDLATDLVSFSLKKPLEEIRSAHDFWYTEWSKFFGSIEEQAGAQADVFLRLRDEFDAFVIGCISQYPQALQSLIPAILAHQLPNSFSGLDKVFELFLCTTYPSSVELAQAQQVDLTLLHLVRDPYSHSTRYDPFISTLVQDYSQAGEFFVDTNKSLAILMKGIIKAMYPLPEAKYRVTFTDDRRYKYEFNPSTDVLTVQVGMDLMVQWLSCMGTTISKDEELAVLLQKHTLQYSTDQFEKQHEEIARISLEYIKKCDIPYLDHTHPQKSNRCIVCDDGRRSGPEDRASRSERRARFKRVGQESEREPESGGKRRCYSMHPQKRKRR